MLRSDFAIAAGIVLRIGQRRHAVVGRISDYQRDAAASLLGGLRRDRGSRAAGVGTDLEVSGLGRCGGNEGLERA